MSKSIFSAPHFNEEEAAYAFVEAQLWPDGPVCPHCGVVNRAGRLKGKSNRPGLWKCYACRKPFTVKVGTIFEASHIAMRDWLAAIHLLCSSKKGISANQLSRTLGITLKSAWFMAHRVREAMGPSGNAPLMGSGGGAVEVDETFIGRKRDMPKRGAHHHKMKVMALVDRNTGEVRSRVLPTLNVHDMAGIIRKNVSKEARLMTDEANFYTKVGREFASHDVLTHGKEEWARGDAHTNTIEGVFSVFKRGMIGTYQHCEERHLHRYANEFDFRYSNRAKLGVDDELRTVKALKGASGKRLTYRTTRGQEAGA